MQAITETAGIKKVPKIVSWSLICSTSAYLWTLLALFIAYVAPGKCASTYTMVSGKGKARLMRSLPAAQQGASLSDHLGMLAACQVQGVRALGLGQLPTSDLGRAMAGCTCFLAHCALGKQKRNCEH